MLKCENTKVMNFEGALRGMRNPMNSWDKSDSWYCEDDCPHIVNGTKPSKECDNGACGFCIGENDLKLAQKLIRAGSEHRKFMRQILVCVDITAPLYWWKEFDTYKVGTVANSCSTMHKIHEKKFTLEDFSCEHLLDEPVYVHDGLDSEEERVFATGLLNNTIYCLNVFRKKYLETKDKKYWWQMIQLLPSSYNQKRTVTLSYENLFAMCSKGQRRFHKLDEWSQDFISWARTLPYSQELIFIDELEERKKYENN